MAVQNVDEPEPPAFPARYSGECSECGDEFDEGELIRADQCGGWSHALCPIVADAGEPFTGTSLDEMGY
jgi:hypothetical protein